MASWTTAYCRICGRVMQPGTDSALRCPVPHPNNHVTWEAMPAFEAVPSFTPMPDAKDMEITALRAEVEEVKAEHAAMLADWDRMKVTLSARDAEVERLKARDKEHAKQVDVLHNKLVSVRLSLDHQNAKLSARDAEVRALRAIAHAAAVLVRVEDSTARTMREWQLAFDLLRTALLTGEPGQGGEGT